ncbi:hypothetical protein [Bradyrhizobium liaoningense]|uniref:hypothetical protein n=1 Tax=Bradyrhizobium liaoningense TaxID=43992 RepID=UPI001BAE4C04|nr:hypothetical protein [Bradyrhizobium liaoningense]MBR0822528.1 hypothetical protein [Bradyrhizobium liaoningense]
MKTPAEYLNLADRIAEQKSSATDPFIRERLDTMERSYRLLAQSATVLAQSANLQNALEQKSK